jgi:hypothetical protein
VTSTTQPVTSFGPVVRMEKLHPLHRIRSFRAHSQIHNDDQQTVPVSQAVCDFWLSST